MAGRNGIDQLNIAIILAAIVLNFVARFTSLMVLSLLATILLVLAAFRILSRNLAKRRAENYRFVTLWTDARERYAAWRLRRRQAKEYRFFVCPGCKNRLRVPRGKGRLQITCPRCGQRFDGKT
jgi:uncharacterized paraquat-inducible protein A